MSAGQLARHRSTSSSTRPSYRAATPIDTRISEEVDFEPCAATASIFLYAQGNAILCLHHDTLAIERRFELHKERVLFIAVDNVSERDQGRLVVSYDASYTAIVWEINSGRQIASFISYEPYRVAAWMKNGKIAFGGSQGSVVLFTPSNTETESARTIFDPITAIAPAWDCQTYAIGFQNGSILLVRLEPIMPKPINGPNLSFTILHTLTTQRAPSPIVNLAWHASSTKQKSDMLASQTMDGDLRIWSVSKPPTAESPKTIRILKRRDNTEPGQHWCAWSKNGRVLQLSDGEGWSWDVRTKHVSCEPLPIVEGVRGVACFGAQAVLFTLGPDHTVQQYDTSPPALVKTVRYGLMLPPPNKGTPAQQIPGTAPPMPYSRGSETDRGAVTLSTIQNTANEMASIDHARQLREEMASPTLSSTSRTDTMSSRSSNHHVYPSRHVPSISSRAQSGTTFSTVSPSMVGRDSLYSGTTSLYQSTASISSAGRRSKGSRLRQEVLRSPEKEYIDLFPRTKMRLSNIAYQQQPQPLDQENLTPDECRRRMLEVVFGWEDDIEALIRDELHYHRQGSQSGVLLAKWLGDVDSDMMAAAISSGGASSSDWMVLCLSQMGGSGMGKLGQAFVQRLLQSGEFHTAATILLGLDQREDAVEVYVSRCFYMEAILLTCLVFPTDWQRQAHLVRRWGEFVVENSQQHLAIRCFSCTGVEPPIPWMSPSPGPISTPSQAPSSISSMLSPPVSPPASNQPMQRMTAKNASLKVITSFEAPAQGNFRFPGLASTDRTPTNGPGVTPIAESAISPGGTPGGFRRNTNNLVRSVATPGGYMRKRLPSIGETPVDVTLPTFPRPSQLPTPDNSGSDLEKEKEKEKDRSRQTKATIDEDKTATATEAPPLLLTSARYDPGSARVGSPMTAVPQTTVRTTVLPEPSQDSFNALMEKSRARNGSRDRKPDGLHIRMPSQDQIQTTHYISSEGKISQGSVEHRRTNTFNPLHSAGLSTSGLSTGGLSTGRSDYLSDTKSPSISGHSWASAKSPSISGRSIDQYISSLEEAGYHQKKKNPSSRRHKSREGREHKARSKGRVGDRSADRGRDERKKIRPAKRSPSSPKPMSPETYIDPMSGEHLDDRIRSPISEGRHLRDTPKTAHKFRSGSKASNYSHHTDRTVVRHRSPEAAYDRLGIDSGFRSGKSSRQQSPQGLFDSNGRGRSKSKNGGSQVRSPSSPLPMSPQADYYRGSDEDEDPLRIVEANRQRLRSRHRSRSRRPRERNTSSRRDMSTDRRREDQYLRTGETDELRPTVEPRRTSGDMLLSAAQQPKLHRQISERTQKKELAARELEARRESLLRNPEAPPILHPDEYSGRPNLQYRAQTSPSNSPTSWDPVLPSHHSQRFPENHGDFINRAGAASVGPYGLPATPRAMRHPRYDNKANDIPAVPEIPEGVQPLPETYYTGQPTFELPRSMSAPIPEPQYTHRPEELPSHPAFHKGLRPGKRNNFSPLNDIGSNRRRPSDDANIMSRVQDTNSIAGVLASADSGVQIISIEEPPLLPELQHLQQQGFPPPPPPPPAPFAHNGTDAESSSLSSNSNVGVISMVLDNEPGDESNVIEVPPPPPPVVQSVRSPPMGTTGSPPPSMNGSGSNHRRGRSENFKNGFSVKGITDRLRSTSRGRNTKSPEHKTPAPYESVPPLYF